MARRAFGLRRSPTLVSLLAYTALAVLLFSRAWTAPGTSWIGDGGDPAQYMWFLRWTPYAVTHGMNPFFTHQINFPHGVNLLWDAAVPLPGLLLAPVTSIFGPVVAYNVAATAAPVLSAWCAYLCFRRYVSSHLAAATGGLLYGFSPYAISHAHGGHLNLSLAFTPPLILLLFDEILVRQRHRAVVIGVALGALVGAQLLISQEILATEAIAAGVGVISLAIVRPRQVRQHLPYAARALAVALGVFVALAAAPIMLALLSSRRPDHGTLWRQDIFVSDVFGFVTPTSLQQLEFSWASGVTNHFTDSCCIAESHTYVGLPLIAVFVIAALQNWSRTIVRVATLLGLTMLVLSLGPHLHVRGHVTSIPLPETWLASVPLLSNVLASRLMLYFYLCAGVLVAISLDGIWHAEEDGPSAQLPLPGMPRPRRSWYALLPIGNVALALVFLFPHVPFPATHATVPAFFASAEIRRIPAGSVALVAPFSRDTDTAEPMLWQAVADMRFRMPEGYAQGPDNTGRYSFLPVPTPLSTLMESIQRGTPVPSLTKAERAGLVHELRTDRVETVIIGPFSQHAPMVGLFTTLLGGPPEHVGGVDVWWNVGR